VLEIIILYSSLKTNLFLSLSKEQFLLLKQFVHSVRCFIFISFPKFQLAKNGEEVFSVIFF